MILNRLLFKEHIKKNIGIIVLTSILFAMSTILPLFMLFSLYNEWEYFEFIEMIAYLCRGSIVSILILIFLAIVMGIKTFSYLHNKKKVDFYHSLPIKRGEIFSLNCITDILSILSIYIFFQILINILAYILGFGEYLDILATLQNIFLNTIFFISIYLIFNLSSILSGNTIIAIILGFFLMNIIPTILVTHYNLMEFCGKSISYTSVVEALENSPIIDIIYTHYKHDRFLIGYEEINLTHIIVKYVLCILIIIAINYLLFLKRKSEKSGVCIAFDRLKGPLKYLIIVPSAISNAINFELITDMRIWGVILAIINCVVAHFIIEITYEFSFKAMFKNWKSIFGCILLTFIIIFGYSIYW